MQLIDKKNRILGKLPVGILFVLLGVFFLGLVVVQTTLTRPDYVIVRIKGSPGNWWWVTPRPPDWLAASISVGNREYNALGQPTAEVLAVSTYDAGGPTKDVFLTVRLSARENKRTNKYRYKGESLEIGGPIALSLDKTFFPGLITELYPEETYTTQPPQKLTVEVKLYDRWPWEFEAIKIGETMTDGSGNVIAEIRGKKLFPAEKEATTADGRIVRALSPVRSDFILTLEIGVTNRADGVIFREEQYVKVGNAIWAQFPSYNISGAQILSIQNETTE